RGEQERLRERIVPYLSDTIQDSAETLPRAINLLISEKRANQKTIDSLVRRRKEFEAGLRKVYNPLIQDTEKQAKIFFGSFARNYHIDAEAQMYLTSNHGRFERKMRNLASEGKIPQDSYNIGYLLNKGEVTCSFSNPLTAFYASLILHQLENDHVIMASQRADKLTAILQNQGLDDSQIYEIQQRVEKTLGPIMMDKEHDDDVARKLFDESPELLISAFKERGREKKGLEESIRSTEAELKKAKQQQLGIIGGLQEHIDGLAALLMEGGLRFPILTGTDPNITQTEIEGKYGLNLSTIAGIEAAIKSLIEEKQATEAELHESRARREQDHNSFGKQIRQVEEWYKAEVQKLREYVGLMEREKQALQDDKGVLEGVLRNNNQYFGDLEEKARLLGETNIYLAEELGRLTGQDPETYQHKAGEETDDIKAARLILKGEIEKLRPAIKGYAALIAKQKGTQSSETESQFQYLRLNPTDSAEVVHTGSKTPETLESVIRNYRLILADFGAVAADIENSIAAISTQYKDLIENLPEEYRLKPGESVIELRSRFFAYWGKATSDSRAHKKAVFEFNKKYSKVLKIQYGKWDGNGERESRLARLDAKEMSRGDKEWVTDLANYSELHSVFTAIINGTEEVLGLRKIADIEEGVKDDQQESLYASESELKDLVALIEGENNPEQQLKQFCDDEKYKFSSQVVIKTRLKHLSQHPDYKEKLAQLYSSPQEANPQADYEALTELISRKAATKTAEPELFKLVKRLNSGITSKSESLAYGKEMLGQIDQAQEHSTNLDSYKEKIVAYAHEEFGFKGTYEYLNSILFAAAESIVEVDSLIEEKASTSTQHKNYLGKHIGLAKKLMTNKSKEYFDQLKEKQAYLVEALGKATGQELSSFEEVKAMLDNTDKQLDTYIKPVDDTETELAVIRKRHEAELKLAHQSANDKRAALARSITDNLYKK
ncbi:hypothetical protein ACFLYT_01750, partial [Nanoarchaeota archaeon]